MNEIFDSLNGGLVILDREQRILDWNAWMVSAAGLSADEVRGKRLDEIFPHADLKRLASAIEMALTRQGQTLITHALNPSLLPLRTRSGRALLHDITISPIGGAPEAGCLLQVTDVTMATKREKYLRDQQNARYDAVVESAPDVILTVDSDGKIQLANPAAVSQFGYTAAELLGRDAAGLFEAGSGWNAIWRPALDRDIVVQQREVTALRKDGTVSYLEASASRWTSGSRLFVTVILRDINERRAAVLALAELNQTLEQRVKDRTDQLMMVEEALRQSQKMEAIGQLTGGIAHDFNNLLTGIIGGLMMARRRIDKGRLEDTYTFIDAAVASAHRAATLTHRLLAFSRRQALEFKPTDVKALIDSMKDLLRRTLGENIEATYQVDPALWKANTDANQLEAALLNLVINARDSMPEGGRLIVTARNIFLAGEAITSGMELNAGDYVAIGVRDSGVGMSPEIVERAFDPFFTTKPIGQGTGLGLSMVYGFAKQSNGSVRIDSEVGKGTLVEIFLPRDHHGIFAESEMPAGPFVAAVHGEVILLVEDDHSVRAVVTEVLKELGYRCLIATNGNEAVAILNSPERIDLLITDIGLPGLDGRQVADIGRRVRPSMKLLFISAYAMDADMRANFTGKKLEIMAKPFHIDALAAKIRELLQS